MSHTQEHGHDHPHSHDHAHGHHHHEHKMAGGFTAAVITLSDKGSRGEREDKSGPAIVEMIQAAGYKIVETLLLPDGIEPLKSELIRLADEVGVNVVFTTGGTGFSERDLTPEATIAACDRMANGIAEAIRYYSLSITPRAMLSRAVSGIRKKTLIINLPGSPKAVREALEYALPSLDHGIGVLIGTDSECAVSGMCGVRHSHNLKQF